MNYTANENLIGAYIKEARLQTMPPLSQKGLASCVRVSRALVAQWETDRRSPRVRLPELIRTFEDYRVPPALLEYLRAYLPMANC